MIKDGGRTIHSEIHKLINYIYNKEKLTEEWKESIILPVYKKSDKTDCSNDRGISLLSNTYKIVSNILLSRLTSYAEELIVDHRCGLRHSISTTDHIFCICQKLKKKRKWEYNKAVHQLFIAFKRACYSVRRGVSYNILTECDITMQLVRLKKLLFITFLCVLLVFYLLIVF